MAYYDQYYTQYPQVQTPLLQGPPTPTYAPGADRVVRQRMAFILAAVLLLIVPLLVSLRPDYAGSELSLEQAAGVEAATDGAVAQEASGSAAESASDVTTNVVAGALAPVFTPEVMHWQPKILEWAAAYGLDPNLVAIIMQIESCGDPNAVSRSGAQGLFQVMPFHFAAGENMQDPDTNAARGMAYFVERLNQTNGDIGRAFAGYNGGHVAAGSSWDNWAHETQRYFVWSTGIYEDIQSGSATSATVQEWLNAGGASLCRQAASRLGL